MDENKNFDMNEENSNIGQDIPVTDQTEADTEYEEVVVEEVSEEPTDSGSASENIEDSVIEQEETALSLQTEAPRKIKTVSAEKVKFASLSAASIILFILIVIGINVVVGIASNRFVLEWDMTQERVFTLDEETLDFLAELNEKELEEPVEIIVLGEEEMYKAYTSDSGTAISPYRYVYETLNNYQRECSNLKVSYVDPRYNPSYFTTRGLSLDDGTDTAKNIFLVVYSPETRRYKYVKDTIFDDLQYVGLERRVTAGLTYVTVENIQTIAIVKGHGEADLPYFADTLMDNGFDVKYITIQEWDDIPDFVSILVITNPTLSYSQDDITKIDNWLNNSEELQHHLMVFSDLDMSSNKYLEAYLAEWGFSLGTDTLFDYSHSYSFVNAAYPILKVTYDDEASIISQDLSTSSFDQYIQLGTTREVNLLFKSKDSRYTYPIIVTYDTAFSRFMASTNLESSDWKSITYQEGDDVGPFTVSAISLQVRYEGTTQFASSVYLAGSTSFVDDYFVSNIDGNNEATAKYLIKLCKYLVQSTQSYDTDILPTQLIFNTLNISTNLEVILIFLGTTIGVPLLFAVIGLIVRRRRIHL